MYNRVLYYGKWACFRLATQNAHRCSTPKISHRQMTSILIDSQTWFDLVKSLSYTKQYKYQFGSTLSRLSWRVIYEDGKKIAHFIIASNKMASGNLRIRNFWHNSLRGFSNIFFYTIELFDVRTFRWRDWILVLCEPSSISHHKSFELASHLFSSHFFHVEYKNDI